MARGPRVHVAISGNRSGSITSRVLRAHHFVMLLDDILHQIRAAMMTCDKTDVVL